MYPLLTRWRRIAVLVATAAATVAALVAVPAAPAQAQPPTCLNVAFSASTWSTGPDTGGFAANIILTNTCPATINGWTLELAFAPDHRLSHGWSANWTAAGSQVTATGLPWNSVLHPGQSTTVGFVGSFSGTYQDPIGCTINGLACDGGGGPGENQPPEVTLTSPADGAGITRPCAVTLAAEATDPDGAVDRVEFYLNDVLVGTADEAPYQIQIPASHPALTYQNVVLARAFDAGSPPLSTDSEPATFAYVIPPPALMIIACTTQLELPEGGSQVVTFQNVCGSTPQVQMTVTGDPGVSVSPTSFTLPATGGAEVTIGAAPGSAGTEAIVRADAAGCLPAMVRVRVVNGGGEPGGNLPPAVTMTSPIGGAAPYPCPIRLAADATDPDGRVQLVEFHLNDQLVGSDDEAPYEVEISANHPALTELGEGVPNTAYARAYDDGDPPQRGVSGLVSFHQGPPPPPGPHMHACNPPGTLAPGDSYVIHFVGFCAESTAVVTVTATGDPGITVDPTSFNFRTDGRDVTVNVAPEAGGATATVTAAGPSCGSATVPITVSG